MEQPRAQWKSKIGFILAASGSAIGLGNIVFFPANAYKYGGGAFYLPYLIALFMIGIPVMITEFGLGAFTKKSFPLAMRQAGGKLGEFTGWFAILNAGFIAMYYITILGWVLGMFVAAATGDVASAFGAESKTHIAWYTGSNGNLANPTGTFYAMVSTWKPLVAVLVVWILNFLLVSRGTKTIELAVKIFVPLMWVAMIVLIVRGVTLPGGFEGVKTLFTPQPEVLRRPEVWQGAMAQMFFTLTLGFGVMTAYASYLPKGSDHSHNAITTSLLNCGFEWIAGVAIFSMLFAFAITPKASTLAMMFFIVPAGIAKLGVLAQAFGIGFFFLLLIAGLTSSISLVEAVVAAAQDKFRTPRWKTLTFTCIVGSVGSACFALPIVVDHGLADNGVLGLTLLDLIDHWAFTYGLLIVGFLECVLIGWGLGARRLREFINEGSRIKLGAWFDWLIKLVIPLTILAIIVFNIVTVEVEKGLYGGAYRGHYTRSGSHFLAWLLDGLHYLGIFVWFACSTGFAYLLCRSRGAEEEIEPAGVYVDPEGVDPEEGDE